MAKQRVIEKPSAVKEVEQWVENLKEEKAAEEKSLEEVEKKISDLLKRPRRTGMSTAAWKLPTISRTRPPKCCGQLADNLADAERAASALKAAGDAMPQEAKDAVERNSPMPRKHAHRRHQAE